MDTHTLSSASAPAAPSFSRSPRLPAWARILMTMIAMLAAYVPIMVISSIPAFREWLKSSNYLVNTVANLSAQLSVGLMMLAFAAMFIRVLDRRTFSALGLRVNTRGIVSLLCGTLLAIAIVWGTAFVLYALGAVSALSSAHAGPADAPVALIVMMFIGQAFLLQGFGEEVLFRGYLMQSLSERPQRALWMSVTAFTVLHLLSHGPQQGVLDRVLYLILPLGFAALAGYLAVLLRSTWAAVGVHGGMHMGGMVLSLCFALDTNTMLFVIVSGLVFLVAGLVVARVIPRARWDEVAAHGPYGR